MNASRIFNACLAVGVAVCAAYSFIAVFYPVESSYLSGVYHECGFTLFENKIPYKDYACPQPPVALVLLGLLQVAWKSFLASRLFSVLVFCILLLVAKKIVENECGKGSPSFLALFLVSPVLLRVSVGTIPVDALCLAFGLSSLYFFRNWLANRRKRDFAFLVVALLLSCFTKYFGLAFFAGLVFYLAATKKTREAIVFASVFAAAFWIGLFALNAATDGYYASDTFFHVLKPPQEGTTIVLGLVYVDGFLYANLLLQLWLNRRRLSLSKYFPFACVLLALVAMVFFLAFKSGGAWNYLVYSDAFALLFTALLLSDVGTDLRQPASRLLAAAFVSVFVFFSFTTVNSIPAALEEASNVVPANSLVEKLVESSDKPVITEFSGLAFWHSKPLTKTRFSDAYMFFDLKRMGEWNDSELIAAAEANEVEIVVFGNRFSNYDSFLAYLNSSFTHLDMCYYSPDSSGFHANVYVKPKLYARALALADAQAPYCPH